MQKRTIFGLIASLAVLFQACKREPLSWDNRVVAPLFKTQLGLGQIDTKFLSKNPSDSSFILNYENLVYSYRMANVRAYDTGLTASFNLKKLKLSDQTIVQQITLGQINPVFKLLNGQTAEIPEQNQGNLAPVDIDASAFFETATLDSGFLDISIANNLPVNVKLVVFELTNAGDNSQVAYDSFSNIPMNGSVTKRIDLKDKTVTKQLKGSIKRLTTEASNGTVLIDANKGVDLKLTVSQLRPRYAIAAFPSQNVIEQDEGLTVFMGGAEVKYFKAKAGNLKIHLVSTIQEDMTMYFEIPSATKNGVVLSSVVKLPAAKPGGSSTRDEFFDLTNYLIDFRGKNPNVKDTVNTFHQILIVRLDSSGRKVAIGLKDSIRLDYRMESLIPDYAIGYMGQSLTQTGDQKAPFDLFKGLNGDFKFKDFKVSLVVKNGIGADGRVKINSLKGENIFTKNALALNATPLNNDILINSPPFVRDAYTESEIVLDAGNSNIKQFMENLPQMLDYNLDMEVNPNGNVSLYKDFVFDNSRVDIFLKVEAPASFSMGEFTLRDTQGIDLKTMGDVSRIKSAKMDVRVRNTFPLGAKLQMNLLDDQLNYLESLDIDPKDQIIEACEVDAKGYPLDAVETVFTLGLGKEKMAALKSAKFIAITTTLVGSGQMQKIYDVSSISVSTVVDFEYEVKMGK
jgi:hypothetical protein